MLQMNPLPNRVVVYVKDVMNITGLGQRAARKLLSAIRKKLNKPPGSFVTVEELAAFTGIRQETIRAFLH